MELNDLNPKFKNTIEIFIKQLGLRLVDNLKSVILYGSVVTGGHIKKLSDINLIVVLNKVDRESLYKISKIKGRPMFGKLTPLVFAENYLINATDTFPMEFLDIQEGYIVLWGRDLIKDIRIDFKNLRHQCEWELKSKILKIQQFYINSGGNDKSLCRFIIKSLPSFIVVFKNVLRLRNILLRDKSKILERIAEEFKLDREIFIRLWEARLGNYRIKNIQETLAVFLSELYSLSDQVDKLKL